MLSLLNSSNRSERIQVAIKALGVTDLAVSSVDTEPEFIYVNGDIKLNDSYEVIKVLASESMMYGTMELEQKVIADQWIDYCRKELEIPVSVLIWLANGNLERESVPTLAEKKARSDIMVALRKIEIRLKESSFIVNDGITIADIILASCLRPLFTCVFGDLERKNIPFVSSWVEKLYSTV